MQPHFWIDWKRPVRVVIFVAALVAIACYWSYLAHTIVGGIRVPHGGPGEFIQIMFIGWVGGWFLALFVRAEDLNLITSYPYESACRAIGGLMILAGIGAGAFLPIAFHP